MQRAVERIDEDHDARDDPHPAEHGQPAPAGPQVFDAQQQQDQSYHRALVILGYARVTRFVSFRPCLVQSAGRKAVIRTGASCLDMTVGGRYPSALAE